MATIPIRLWLFYYSFCYLLFLPSFLSSIWRCQTVLSECLLCAMPGLMCFLPVEEYCIDSTNALSRTILVDYGKDIFPISVSAVGINAISLDRKCKLELHVHKLQSKMWKNISAVLGACGPGKDTDGGQSRKKDFGRNLFFSLIVSSKAFVCKHCAGLQWSIKIKGFVCLRPVRAGRVDDAKVGSSICPRL